MGQINISADNQLIADIDRIAAALGVSRPELLRKAMHEVIEAHDGERLAFAREEGPKLDASLSSLAAQLRTVTVELDQTLRGNDKIAKRLIDATNVGADAYRHALDELTQRLVAQRKEANLPFQKEVGRLRSDIAALPGAIGAQVSAGLVPLQEQFAAVAEEARAPRSTRNLIIGREFVHEWQVIGVMSACWLCIGIALLLLAANVIPGLGRSLANQFVDTDIALCQQLNRRFRAKDCAVPDLRRRNALIAIDLEQRP